MVMINHGVNMDSAPIPSALRNVEKLIRKPYCQPFPCTNGMIGQTLSGEIKARGFRAYRRHPQAADQRRYAGLPPGAGAGL